MDSNRIRNLATGAREALRNEASARLDAVLAEGSAARLESPSQVSAIEADIDAHGRDEVVDRAAYTWFNRLCALRFMDANGYTPTLVVTPRPGQTQPAVLADAAQGVFDPEWGIPQEAKQRVAGLLSGSIASPNAAEDAYSLLLRAVCARYAGPMPYLFAEDVASSLLMPQGLLAQGSILSRIVEDMDGEACSSVEVMGWLYQFYIAERKDQVFANYKKGKKAQAEDIAPATQLFTLEWIVRYLTENSLGRLWMLNNPGSELARSMEYYVAPEGDEPHVDVASADEIRVLDPACGSGHILVYAFDLLFRMYEEEGWPAEDIPRMILENNLFGLEIDRRAAEIASFALEMKARARDPRWFEKRIDAHVHVLEPVGLLPQELDLVPQLAERAALLEAMEHMDEVGSLYVPDPLDESTLQDELERVGRDGSLFAEGLLPKLRAMLANVRALAGGYHCVIANPPYMGSGYMNSRLSGWVKSNYPDEKSDLCTCFISRGLRFTKSRAFAAIITSDTCMYLSSYEALRKKIISNETIITFADTRGSNAHPDVFDANAVWVMQHEPSNHSRGFYFKLNHSIRVKGDALVEAICNPDCGWFYRANAEDFKAIPGWPIAYWASQGTIDSFVNMKSLATVARPRQGLVTGDNERFLRFWWEIAQGFLGYGCESRATALTSGKKWFPCNKGGEFRKWYGNNYYVVNWENDGDEIRSFYKNGRLASRPQNIDFYFHEGLTWSALSSASLSMRFSPAGFISEHKGTMCFGTSHKDHLLCLSAMNSTPAEACLKILCPTLDFGEGAVGKVPIADGCDSSIEYLSEQNISVTKEDWDSFETSWDFSSHPLVKGARVADAYALWESECRERFDRLRANEEELNRIFARIYHMEGEVPIEVPGDKVSVRLADRARDARSLVSYGIGCMLGRYSTAADGLVLADQGATLSDFLAKAPDATFLPDVDNVLPVLADEWFDDDVVSGFRAWLADAYGEETLEENVAWLEGSLGKDLRSYLCKDFYADHLKVYQKRPIYWMFQSPKRSFQCLVYMHRYDEGTVGTILTGYLRPLEDKLLARLQALETPSASAADAREANRVRGMVAELEQWEREVVYPLAHERVSIDLDDGVKKNYNKFPKALAKVPGLSEWR